MSGIRTQVSVTHHREVFSAIKDYIGEEAASDQDHFNKFFFTYDDPQMIEYMTGGPSFKKGIKAKNIDKLSPKNGHHKFFTKEVSIKAEGVPCNTSKRADENVCDQVTSIDPSAPGDFEQLTPRMHYLKIANT